MDGKSAATIKHFFKVMLPGFHEKLDIPPAFCEKLKHEKSNKATLTSTKGVWDVSVSKNGECLICFSEGWSDFACVHDVNVGDFVVFQHRGGMHFNTFIFDPTNCEKEFLVQLRGRLDHTSDDLKTTKSRGKKRKSDEISDKNDKTPNFIITMKPSHEKWEAMTIPVEFLRSNHIAKDTRNVYLRDPSGKTWPINLYFQQSNSKNQCRMRKGWSDFYKSNKLKIGDTCLFELVHPNSSEWPNTTFVFDVKINPA